MLNQTVLKGQARAPLGCSSTRGSISTQYTRRRLLVQANAALPKPGSVQAVKSAAAAALASLLVVRPQSATAALDCCCPCSPALPYPLPVSTCCDRVTHAHAHATSQAVSPAGAVELYAKPNTVHLGSQSRSAAAELEAIISSRTGSSRALPSLTASPALLVSSEALAAGC